MDAKTAAAAEQRFGEVITSELDLRKIVGPPNRWFTSKVLHRLDQHCQNFIAAPPFVVVGSTDPLGMVDLSPKGDRAGFVRCLDDATLRFRIAAATGGWILSTTCCRIPASG